MAFFRVTANYSFTLETSWSKYEQEFCDKDIAISRILNTFCDDRKDTVIFLRLDALQMFRTVLNAIFFDFQGTFVIDSMDAEMLEKPDWVGPNAVWVSPHISNPFDSSGLCIPVGVEELSLNRNGRISNLNVKSIKNRLVIVGPFAPTHRARSEFASWNSNAVVDVMHHRLKPKEYANLVSDYKFVVCPRGNGIDTHRFWETLYRGSIPIVESSDWARYFQSHGIPILIVASFKELLSWRESDFLAIWSKQAQNPSEITGLWPDYWANKIRTFRENCGERN